jgi:phosphotriesterase-related protein
MDTIHSVTGPIRPDQLGTTLMHEHVMIGYPGWEADSLRPGPGRDEMFSVCVDRIEEMKALGITSMLDPCPNDLGRDVEFMFGDVVGPMTELFVHELTEGIGGTGIKAGILKVGTGHATLTEYERSIFEAAARAAVETGAPITTHTDGGRFGDDQQAFLTQRGVPAHRIIIGHSCGTRDHAYHCKIVEGGSYLGFDRFGLDVIHPDDDRVKSLLALLQAGHEQRVVVSHDSVWCWRGEPAPPEVQAGLAAVWNPTHFHTRIVPRLLEGGASKDQIETLLVANPRRFFAGEA